MLYLAASGLVICSAIRHLTPPVQEDTDYLIGLYGWTTPDGYDILRSDDRLDSNYLSRYLAIPSMLLEHWRSIEIESLGSLLYPYLPVFVMRETN